MEKVWLQRYPSDVPADINPNDYQTLLDVFEQSAAKYADRVAYINMGQVMTYRRLEEQSRAFAAYLQNQLKLQKGDRVALMMPNLLQYPICLFGVLRAGMVVVNVNPLYTPRELKHQLNDSGAKAIVIVSNFAHTLEEVVDDTQIEHVILTRLGDQLSATKRTLVNFVVKYIKKMVPKYDLPQAQSLRYVLAKGQHLQYIRPELQAEDMAFLQYTGGTTGVAKGAMLSHQNMVANLLQALAIVGPCLREGKEIVVTALPLYHIFALTANCMLFIALGCQNLLITNPRDIPTFIKELSKTPFTAMTGVNTLFNALLNHPDFAKLDFSSLRLSMGGGMSVQHAVAERWQQLTECRLIEGYGLTECAPLVTVCPYDLAAYNGSIGLPAPSTEVCLVDDKGNEVAKGEAGELLVKGPQVMLGYWQRPEATEEAMPNGWFATGDIATMDDQGFFHIVDRKKDMILVSGFNVFPNEIEEVLSMNPKVLEAAAIGVKSELSGEAVKVVIVKKDDSLDERQVIQHCRQHLTSYKVPKIVEFRDELPKTNVGKILRRALRDQG